MAKASGRRRQNIITSLKIDGVIVTDQTVLTEHITCFYKQLFGSGPSSDFSVNFNLKGWLVIMRTGDY